MNNIKKFYILNLLKTGIKSCKKSRTGLNKAVFFMIYESLHSKIIGTSLIKNLYKAFLLQKSDFNGGLLYQDNVY